MIHHTKISHVTPCYAITILLLAAIFSVGTHIAPIFWDFPSFIFLNIIGTFLVSLSFGTLVGCIYVVLINILFNSIGMGAGVSLHILLLQVFIALAIAVLYFKAFPLWINIFLIAIFLSISVKPLGFVLYALLNNGRVFEAIQAVGGSWVGSFLSSIMVYSFSGIGAYILIVAVDAFFRINQKDSLYEKQ